MTDEELIAVACETEGMSRQHLLQEGIFDSVCVAICTECHHVERLEPDQDRGWCEVCDDCTMKSVLVLAGMI